ncbi:hypothetical protein DEM26_19035 [Thioclava sp. NG1]|uniref:hypothetical protein n=1 Tax=Thioclava sp. NG1 TaxID=2182426 RepID=UPI000D61F898|nr:hypothetical protein [Thioclava sp. NG1]PWE48273.1 hypothetical protein DEM26_19035 [Thioclava sp. NG1]
MALSLHRKQTMPLVENGDIVWRKGTGAYLLVIPSGPPAAEVSAQVETFLDIEKGRPSSAPNAHLG